MKQEQLDSLEVQPQNVSRPRTRSGQELITEQKAGGGSIDGAIQLFAKSEHDYLKKELAKWASDMINEEISLPFSSSLASGVKLCKLVEKVSRVHVAGVHPEKKCTVVNGSQAEISRAQIFKTENLNLFLEACKAINIPAQDLFTPEDLSKGEDRPVLHCLLAILRKADMNGILISNKLRNLANLGGATTSETKPLIRAHPTAKRAILPPLTIVLATITQIGLIFVLVTGSLETIVFRNQGMLYTFGFFGYNIGEIAYSPASFKNHYKTTEGTRTGSFPYTTPHGQAAFPNDVVANLNSSLYIVGMCVSMYIAPTHTHDTLAATVK